MSYTYVTMDVSPQTYAEIRAKLVAAEYQHALHKSRGSEVLDMHGITLSQPKDAVDSRVQPVRLEVVRILDDIIEGWRESGCWPSTGDTLEFTNRILAAIDKAGE